MIELATTSEILEMEEILTKVPKGVKSIEAVVKEIKKDLFSMSQLADSHSTFIKQL